MLDRADRSDEAVVALQRALQLATSVDSNYLRAAVLFKLSSVAGYKGALTRRSATRARRSASVKSSMG